MRKIIACYMAAAGLFISAVLATSASAPAAQAPLPATPATVAAYATVLRHINPQLPKWQSQQLARHVLVNSKYWHIDPNMLVAIVTVESRWHTHAISRAGAIGLGQLMPGTAALLGVNPHDPAENLNGAAEYLGNLIKKFGTNYTLVFAAYNAGPKAVDNYGGVPPYDETQRYVVKVMKAWETLKGMVHLSPADLELANVPNSDDAKYWLDAQTR